MKPKTERVLGVLTGQVPVQVNAPACETHKEVQHRDYRPPWCNTCGWSHGRAAVAPQLLGEPRT